MLTKKKLVRQVKTGNGNHFLGNTVEFPEIITNTGAKSDETPDFQCCTGNL